MNGGFETNEIINVIQREYVLEIHKKKKYRCKCGDVVVTAPGPRPLIPGGRYSLEFGVQVAVDKFADHLPLSRQTKIAARAGLDVDTQTLWDQIRYLGSLLAPHHEKILQEILRQPMIHVDETRYFLMGKGKTKTIWDWVLASPCRSYHVLHPSRSRELPRKILQNYPGVCLVDGYSAYQSLQKEKPTWSLAFCWAHARRQFFRIRDLYPEEAEWMLDRIGELYAVEGDLPPPAPHGPSPPEVLAERKAIRMERARPVVAAIRERVWKNAGGPKNALRKAYRYLLNQWPGLVKFLEHPEVPLDNNPAERTLRCVAVGRKNYYGVRSWQGAKVAGIFYSLIETAKLCRVDPRAYLMEAARRVIADPDDIYLPEPKTD
jgi:transposase